MKVGMSEDSFLVMGTVEMNLESQEIVVRDSPSGGRWRHSKGQVNGRLKEVVNFEQTL